MNSRLIMLTLLTVAIGGVLGISVMQYYSPGSGQRSSREPLLASPQDHLKED